MNHKEINYYLDDNNKEAKKGPFVKEIILPINLYQYAVNRGNETYKEVGFYLIGFFKKGICYIYDLIEFEYSEQNGGFIESGLGRYLRLKVGLPFGLQLVGHMHKHPGFTHYSAIDKQNFLQYGYANPLNAFLIYTVNPYSKVEGYTATAERVFPLKVTIRDLSTEEKLLEKELKIEFTTKLLLPKNTTFLDFTLLFSEKIGSETLKFLSRPTFQINGILAENTSIISEDSKIHVSPRKAVEIEDIGKNNVLRYRVFLEEGETIADLEKILKKLTHLPQKKGYDIILYENGRKLSSDTKIKDIRYPLVWRLEKSILSTIFQNFYKFWKGVTEILRKKGEEKIQEVTHKIKIEARDALSKDTDGKSGFQIIFKNFYKFWNDIITILSGEEAKKTPKTKKTQDTIKVSENDSEKKPKRDKNYSLDYFI